MSRPPHLFCIGMQKAGTTWLSDNLKSHPRFYPAAIKEPHYFDGWHYWPRLAERLGHAHSTLARDNRVMWSLLESLDISLASLQTAVAEGSTRVGGIVGWLRRLPPLRQDILSPGWYEKVFAGVPEGSITGDFTADTYLLDAEGIDAILEWNPDAKFVLLLRDPVTRDWSQLRMLRKSEPNRTFAELLRSPQMVRRDEYEDILTLWERKVGPDRLHIDFYDHTAAAPRALLNRVCGFLGLEPRGDDWPRADTVGFRGPSMELPAELRRLLIERNARALAYLADRFGQPCVNWRRSHLG